jgi:hypothetical protein
MTSRPKSPSFRPDVHRLEDRTTPAIGYALNNANQLIRFDTADPSASASAVTLQGLGGADVMMAIDVRPQNGMLYGLAAAGGAVRLYAISTQTGFANALSVPLTFTNSSGAAVPITGTEFDIDFNPTVDRVRVVTNTGFNFRMNPNTGALVDSDGNSANGINPDTAIGGSGVTGLQGTAYTNNSANVLVTTQYGLDETTGRLFIQNPPNSGTQTVGLPLTFGTNFVVSDVSGLDILSNVTVDTANAAVTTGVGYAFLTGQNSTGAVNGLAEINLTSGAVNKVTALGTAGTIVSLALQSRQPATGAPGVPAIALSATGNQLLRFNTATPGTVTTVTIDGLTSGETLVGLDARPATGVMYALGVNAAANNATLYTLDPQGTAGVSTLTAVGTVGAIGFVTEAGAVVDLPDATVGYGFDFNPTADRIRVVTGNGLNFRVNPNDGQPVDANTGVAGNQLDIGINGPATGASGTAYTNSFGQTLSATGVTTQYTLDAAGNNLYIQTPPNSGTQTNRLPITLNGAALDFTDVNAFDIDPTVQVSAAGAAAAAGRGYAALTVGGATGLYAIDLPTGQAVFVGAISTGTTGVVGLTVGQPGAATTDRFAVGTGPGTQATVVVRDAAGNQLTAKNPFGGFSGGVTVATGDITGDGVADIVVGARAGGGPNVVVYDGVTFNVITNFFAYNQVFRGGVNVGVGDVDGDGKAEIITGAGPGGGPHVRVLKLSGANVTELRNFFPYNQAFRGGAFVSAGDLNGDGKAEIVTGAGAGGGPHVRAFDGVTGAEVRSFFAYVASFSGGVNVGVGDVTGDTTPDIITGAGAGAGSNVKVFDGRTNVEVRSFLAYDANFRGGVNVAPADLDGDGIKDIITGPGAGGSPHVRAFRVSDLAPILNLFPFAFNFTGGVDVG